MFPLTVQSLDLKTETCYPLREVYPSPKFMSCLFLMFTGDDTTTPEQRYTHIVTHLHINTTPLPPIWNLTSWYLFNDLPYNVNLLCHTADEGTNKSRGKNGKVLHVVSRTWWRLVAGVRGNHPSQSHFVTILQPSTLFRPSLQERESDKEYTRNPHWHIEC